MENEKAQESFKSWAVLELFGHQTLAGYVSDFTFGGDSFVRVDVPETSKEPAFTKMYGAKAIYSISPVSEVVARSRAEAIGMKPITVYSPEILSKKDADTLKAMKQHFPDQWKEAESGKLLPATTIDEDDDEDDLGF